MPKNYIRRTGYSKKGVGSYKRKPKGLKKSLRSAAKRFMSRVFKRRELNNSEQKWFVNYYTPGLALLKTDNTTGTQITAANLISVIDLFNLSRGVGISQMVGDRIQAQGITFNFALGNTNSSTGWSGIVTMVIVNEKTPGGFAPLDYTTGTAALKFPTTQYLTTNGAPNALNYTNSLNSKYTIKFKHKKIDFANQSTVGLAFDQNNQRVVFWKKHFKMNRPLHFSAYNTVDAYRGCRKFIFFIYYDAPWTQGGGTEASRPKVQGSFMLKFKDL